MTDSPSAPLSPRRGVSAGISAVENASAAIAPIQWILLALFCLILFGFAGFSGRPLTMHEARLPETSREMLHNHQWLLPTSGGRPWLERPPLPHWLVISCMKIFGRDDQVWIVRLPSALMGTITVMLAAFIASRWFGATVGIVAGYVLATSLKFYQYSALAEDDIYLAMLVALAVALFTMAELRDDERKLSLINNRRWPVWLFFIVLGLTNLTKGPLLGLIILGPPIAVYLLIRARESWQPLSRYLCLWGWLILLTLTIAWPLWAYHRHPDVLENWKYDYLGRMSGDYTAINEPWWYYPPQLAAALLPWTPIALLGAVIGLMVLVTPIWPRWRTRQLQRVEIQGQSTNVLSYESLTAEPWWYFPRGLQERIDRANAENAAAMLGYLLVLCWAIIPVLVLSIPKGKHDHYLVPFLAPWGILGGVGLIELGRLIHAGRRTLAVVMILLLIGFSLGEAVLAPPTDHTLDDTAFLRRGRTEVPADIPLYIDGKLGPPGNLDFFRMQFYSRPDAILLHNLSFLRDQHITAPVVDVIARERDRHLLEQLGSVKQIDQSKNSHEQGDPKKAWFGRFTLYQLTFNPRLKRYPAPASITSLQAMERAPGPWCGPPMK